MLGTYRAMNFIMFEKRLFESIDSAISEKQHVIELLKDQTEGDILSQSNKYIKATEQVEQLLADAELNQYDDLFKPVLLQYMYQREVKQDMMAVK